MIMKRGACIGVLTFMLSAVTGTTAVAQSATDVAAGKQIFQGLFRRAGVFETSPIVADGVMYLTEPPSTVTALDVRTGRPLWTYTPTIPDDVIIIGSPPVNRGVAILDDRVFAGSVAGHLTALDAKSGAVRWDVAVEDNKQAYYLTLAPLALDGKIIVGVSGAEAGIRGFVDAYDPKTGKRLWRTFTIPAPANPDRTHGRETVGRPGAAHRG